MARSRARRALAACLQVASGMAAAALVSLRAAGRSVRPVTAAGALVGLAVIITASAPPPTAASRPNLRWDDARPSAGHPAGTHLAAAHVHSHDAGSRATRVAAVAHAVPVPPTRDRQRPYRVAVGPTEVDVFVDLDVMGYGVRVSKPQPGGIPVGSPACVHGSTPSTLVVPTCS